MLLFAGARRREVDSRRLTGRASERRREIENARADSGTDVVGASGNGTASRKRRGGSSDERVAYIDDVDIVARLASIPERRQRSSLEHRAEEDRDDTSLAIRVLPRPIGVADAQRGRLEPQDSRVVRHEQLR